MAIIQKAKKKIIDVASDMMSAPARIKAEAAKKKADQDVADIKLVRETKNVDTSDKDYRDPVFRARANVSNMKFEREYSKKMSGKSHRF
jgi:hypothetical protein